MLSLNAREWKSFEGGYKIIYDASVPLRKLESLAQPSKEIWNELWEELFHQGDVGIASYASVPQIYRIYQEKSWIDFELPSFVSAVEQARLENHNPKLPKLIEEEYFDALQETTYYCLKNFKEDLGKDFSKAVLLLVAILMKDKATYKLLDLISVGDEEKVLELYYEHC